MDTTTRPHHPTANIAHGTPVKVVLPHGTTVYGHFAGRLFGDPCAPAKCLVQASRFVWADGTVVQGGGTGEYWGVEVLTAAEKAAEDARTACILSYVD